MMRATLRIGESVRVGDVMIRLDEIGAGSGRRVKVSINAPLEMRIVRQKGDGYDHSADDELLAAMMERP